MFCLFVWLEMGCAEHDGVLVILFFYFMNEMIVISKSSLKSNSIRYFIIFYTTSARIFHQMHIYQLVPVQSFIVERKS